MDLKKLEAEFKQNIFCNEDDVKIHFHSDIVKPILKEVNPSMIGQYRSEATLLAGGRADANFQNISLEFKKLGHFDSQKGIDEALLGRDDKDHGLYDYLISNASILATDSDESITRKLMSGIGIGFDGKRFIFARFIPSTQKSEIRTNKVSVSISNPLNLSFYSEIKDFPSGLKRLVLLLKQQDKMALNKQNLLSVINTKSSFVRDSIISAYKEVDFNLHDLKGRVGSGVWDCIW